MAGVQARGSTVGAEQSWGMSTLCRALILPGVFQRQHVQQTGEGVP